MSTRVCLLLNHANIVRWLYSHWLDPCHVVICIVFYLKKLWANVYVNMWVFTLSGVLKAVTFWSNISYVCMHVCACQDALAMVLGEIRGLPGVGFSLQCVGSGDWAWSPGLHGKCFHSPPPSLLAGPWLTPPFQVGAMDTNSSVQCLPLSTLASEPALQAQIRISM